MREQLLAAAVIGFAGGLVVGDVYVFGPITQGLVDVLAALGDILRWPARLHRRPPRQH